MEKPYYKHLYCNINKSKLKKLDKFIHNIDIYNKVVHSFGEYKIEHNSIIDITNIPIQYYKKNINFNGLSKEFYINDYIVQDNKYMHHIPYQHNIIHTKKITHKLNNKSQVLFIIEKNIMIDENSDILDIDFDDNDNKIFKEYYFVIRNNSEDSHFIKEDIFAFLNYLN
jgi:hypothetical protein